MGIEEGKRVFEELTGTSKRISDLIEYALSELKTASVIDPQRNSQVMAEIHKNMSREEYVKFRDAMAKRLAEDDAITRAIAEAKGQELHANLMTERKAEEEYRKTHFDGVRVTPRDTEKHMF